jgi:hypothetical protein
VARWLATLGVAGFVLSYRVAPHRHPLPLLDAHQAIRTLRGVPGRNRLPLPTARLVGAGAQAITPPLVSSVE